MDEAKRYYLFGQELTAIQRKLYLFIVSLVGNPNEVDDILQETNRVVWEKIKEFEEGTNFVAWVFSIARYEVLKWRKNKGRDKMCFSESTLASLADKAMQTVDAAEMKKQALSDCLHKLREGDRDMIVQRYLSQVPVVEVAKNFGRSEKSIYQSLSRIRNALLSCIKQHLAKEGL